jgi:archaellum component FlaG (FlaF/FlaG flagellin family)
VGLAVSESLPSVILFIGVVVVAASLVGVLNQQVSHMESNALAKKSELEEKLVGGIKVVHVNTEGNNLSIYVENVGSVALDPDQSKVRINGEWVEPSSIEVINPRGNELWGLNEIIEINLTASLIQGWNYVAVLNRNLWTPYYRFKGGS